MNKELLIQTCCMQLSVSKTEGFSVIRSFSEVIAQRKSDPVCFSFPGTQNASKETKQNRWDHSMKRDRAGTAGGSSPPSLILTFLEKDRLEAHTARLENKLVQTRDCFVLGATESKSKSRAVAFPP